MTPQALTVLKGTVHKLCHKPECTKYRVARYKKYNLQEMQEIDHGNTEAADLPLSA